MINAFFSNEEPTTVSYYSFFCFIIIDITSFVKLPNYESVVCAVAGVGRIHHLYANS